MEARHGRTFVSGIVIPSPLAILFNPVLVEKPQIAFVVRASRTSPTGYELWPVQSGGGRSTLLHEGPVGSESKRMPFSVRKTGTVFEMHPKTVADPGEYFVGLPSVDRAFCSVSGEEERN